jgi:hypothetical protein
MDHRNTAGVSRGRVFSFLATVSSNPFGSSDPNDAVDHTGIGNHLSRLLLGIPLALDAAGRPRLFEAIVTLLVVWPVRDGSSSTSRRTRPIRRRYH